MAADWSGRYTTTTVLASGSSRNHQEVYPECGTSTVVARLERNPEVYNTMNGPSEFHVIGTLKDWSVVDRLGEIDVPTLVTSGRYDEATPAIAETVHRGIAGSEWTVFEQSAHCAHAEEPERYCAVPEAFLTRVERQS